MLYAVPYDNKFSSKSEEASYQRELVRKLLTWAVKREYGAESSALNVVYGIHGKPAFSNHPARFSLSHCPGLVCCGVSEEEIGVDAEPVRPFDFRLAHRICTPGELEFLTSAPDQSEALTALWTLKESLMKLTGEGMRYGFRNAAFTFDQGKPVPASPGIWAACFKCVPDFLVSVCCRGRPPEELKLVDLSRLF